MRRSVLLALAALLLAACTVGPDYRRPEYPVPPTFRGQAPEDSAPSVADLQWWQIFQDETLQQLIRSALAENYDLRVAAARILDARAQVVFTRSFQFPEINAGGSAPYQRIEGDRDLLQPHEQFSPSGGLNFGFELDFWGRFRRATEAARADLLASEDARRFVMSTLVSDLATAYFQLRSLDAELQVAQRTLAPSIHCPSVGRSSASRPKRAATAGTSSKSRTSLWRQRCCGPKLPWTCRQDARARPNPYRSCTTCRGPRS